MYALVLRSELISTPKTRSVVSRAASRIIGLPAMGDITLPGSTFKDDKLPGLLRVQPQIIRPGPVRDVIKLRRCSRKIVRDLEPASKYELSAYFIGVLNA